MKGVLQKIVDVRAAEIRALWLGFVFSFSHSHRLLHHQADS
jgi:hypothetical protein